MTALLGHGRRSKATAVRLVSALAGEPVPPRPLYAEIFAPLLDFGWASLRSVREGGWKYIAAPKPELYDTGSDPARASNRVASEAARAARAADDRLRGGAADRQLTLPTAHRDGGREAAASPLGYLQRRAARQAGSPRPDPKDRDRDRVAVGPGHLRRGDRRAAISTLESILRSDPQNPQAHLRLGYAEVERGNRCDRAEPHFRAALAAGDAVR